MPDVEIIWFVGAQFMALAQETRNLLLGGNDVIRRARRKINIIQPIFSRNFVHGRGDRKQYEVILIAAVRAGSLGRENANNGARQRIDANRLSDGFLPLEQDIRDAVPEDADVR